MQRLSAAILTALLVLVISSPAFARHHHSVHLRHHQQEYIAQLSVGGPFADSDVRYGAIPTIVERLKDRKRHHMPNLDANGNRATAVASGEGYYRSHAGRSDVKYIPNPPGTWRVVRSCAHRLAAYWGLGRGLDAVSTWAHKFPRTAGPCVGCAAIRSDQGHVMGIIGGGPGAWRVADFNSGEHLNREYTVASFPNYFFVRPHGVNARKAETASRI